MDVQTPNYLYHNNNSPDEAMTNFIINFSLPYKLCITTLCLRKNLKWQQEVEWYIFPQSSVTDSCEGSLLLQYELLFTTQPCINLSNWKNSMKLVQVKTQKATVIMVMVC